MIYRTGSKGFLLARMDANATSHPQRLQKQFGYMKRNPDCDALYLAQVNDKAKSFVQLDRHNGNVYYFNLTFESRIYPATVMFRK